MRTTVQQKHADGTIATLLRTALAKPTTFREQSALADA